MVVISEASPPESAITTLNPSFRVLGPVQALTPGGADLTPRARKVRTVLALLMVRANTVVPLPSLMRELWGDVPPRTAPQALRVYVSKVRTLLAAMGPGAPVLSTRQAGYRLEVSPGQVDVLEFERLYERGRGADDAETAALCFHQALGLWRGPALADVCGGPLLEGAALRLEEARLVTLARRIDLDLRLRRHLDVVGELRELTAGFPLNEGFQALLMIALHRSGRTGEALALYRDVRNLLVDELGVEPGEELRRVHQAVLTADDRTLFLPLAR